MCTKDRVTYAACKLVYLAAGVHPAPQIPWAIPDLGAGALQNSNIHPSPSCPEHKGPPSSYLLTEDLLALGVVNPCSPAPVSEALPVAIV